MSNPKDSERDRSTGANTGDVRHPTDNPAVDPRAAAQQDQVHADHDALHESARRVEASVSESVRSTPIGSSSSGANGNNTDGRHHADPDRAATDPVAAARQEQVKADHDAMQASAERVDASVSSEVRDQPVRPSNAASSSGEDNSEARRNSEVAHDNADAARESARRR